MTVFRYLELFPDEQRNIDFYTLFYCCALESYGFKFAVDFGYQNAKQKLSVMED